MTLASPPSSLADGRFPRRGRGRRALLGVAMAAAVTTGMAGIVATADAAEAQTRPESEPTAPAADPPADPTLRLPEERVVGEREEAPRFVPDVKGPEIFAGKKTAVIDPDRPPKVVNDNYRQVLSRTPGLTLSEEASPLVSIGYRGLDPHRTQYTLVLKDGIPIPAGLFGYPENYYLPPIDSIEQIDFVHGGAALLYGPQPGGTLNFITRKPNPTKPFSLYTSQTFGSYDFYSTYNALSGTVDRTGYYVYYYQKQGDGFRDGNSDFDLYSGSAKITHAITDASRIQVTFDGYNEEHGEPGGLTFTPGPNAALYEGDRSAVSRRFDRFRLKRYIGSAIYENDLSDDTLLRVAAWGGYYERFSKRQRGGGFGTLPTGADANTNSIENQKFYTSGLDARVRHDWTLFGDSHTLATGVMYYHDDSPRVDKRGARPDAEDGEVRNDSHRTTDYGSVFVENRFVFGNLSIVPSGRLETFSLSIDEAVNVSKADAGVPLSDDTRLDVVPLVGLGVAYTLLPTVEVYANASSGYRPAIFTQAVSTSPTTDVPGDLAAGNAWQYEVGFRGNPQPWLYWDTSLFWLDFDNQIGTVQVSADRSEIRNVGRAWYRGWEAATEVGLVGLYDHLRGTTHVGRCGDFSIYGNVTLLDAELIRGEFEDNVPAYAPDYVVRAGVQYSYRNLVRASLLSTAVSQHFANDNNTGDFYVPPYEVWDLTVEANVYRDMVAIHAGVNNLFDENYYARIRSDGIDPAMGRNFYGGVKLYF
jgi:Fe(3+) dicitrate transport protein